MPRKKLFSRFSDMPVSRTPSVGAVPGTLYIPEDSPPPAIDAIVYNPDGSECRRLSSIDELDGFADDRNVLWLDVNGLGDPDVIRSIGRHFGFHRLSLEDATFLEQRPKMEIYEDVLYMVVQLPVFTEEGDFEQISIFLGPRYVVTFQAFSENNLVRIRERIERGQGQIRHQGASYLAYAIVDLAIDAYFPLLEKCDREIEEIEERLERGNSRHAMPEVFDLKRRILKIRRMMWASREMVNQMLRSESPLIDADTAPFLRDTQDHIVRILEMAGIQRELCSGLVDLHQSIANQKMNEVMKVLTVIATIFIPITFVAGIYGMNFDPGASPWNMPELAWTWGYPAALTLMLLITAGMLLFFRRKGWIFNREDAP